MDHVTFVHLFVPYTKAKKEWKTLFYAHVYSFDKRKNKGVPQFIKKKNNNKN